MAEGARLGVEALVDSLGPWSAGEGPLYRKLADATRAGIARGELRPGVRLPSERALARALAVSRTTVVGAYEALCAEDLLHRRQGSGTYVRRRRTLAVTPSVDLILSVQTTSLREPGTRGGDGTIQFTAATFSGDGVITDRALTDLVASLPRLRDGSGYTILGSGDLRRAVAGYYTAAGVPTSEEQILVTTGAQQAIWLTASLLIEPGEAVLVEDPTWVGAVDAFRAARARIVSLPVDREGVSVEACAHLVARHSPRLLYLSPTVHNPTGALMSERRRAQLVALVGDTGLPVLEDNTLSELLLGGRAPRPLAAREPGLPVFTVGSMSKLYWGGLRIGWVRTAEPMVTRLAHLKLVMDHGTPLISQALAVHLLADIDAVRQARREQIRAGLELLTATLREMIPEWAWQPPDGGLSLWVRIPRGNATEFAQVALRHGVAIVPGSVLSPSHAHGRAIRLPFAQRPEQMREGVRRLAGAWRTYSDTLEVRTVEGPVI